MVNRMQVSHAGTYTPIAYLGIGGATGTHLLRLVWGGAAAGILQMLFLPKAPRLLTTLIYIALGWVIVPHATEVRPASQVAHGHCSAPLQGCWETGKEFICSGILFQGHFKGQA